MNKNFIKLWFRDAFVSASASFASVSVLSAFFLRGGMTAAQVSFYITLTQAANLIISLLFSGITEKYRNTKKSLSILYIAGGAVTLLFAVFCVLKPPSGLFYAAVLLIGGGLQVTSAIRYVFEYKLPCEVMDIKDYSTYVAFSSIFGGGAGILAGITLTVLFKNYDFMAVTGFAFVGSGICMFIAAALNLSLKIVCETKTDGKSLADPVHIFIKLIHNRDFRALIIPNFIRGIGAGVVAMITVLAISGLGLDDSEVPMITTMTYLGTLVSCLVYAFTAKKLGSALSCLIGSVLFCLLAPSFCGTNITFFILFFISNIGYNVVCCAIPAMVYESVPAEIIGAFHTWRLALTTFGTVLSTAVIGILSDKIPESVILTAGVASIFICSLWYYLYYRRERHT